MLISTCHEPMVILKTDLTIVNATPAFVDLFSLKKESIIGKSLYHIIDGGIKIGQFNAKLDDLLKSHNFHASFEVEYVNPQHGTRTVLVKPRRIYQPPNLLFTLEFSDLTEDRARMEEKDVFISVASHEIRTPESVIRAYSQILDRELKEAKPIIRQAVRKINEQVNFLRGKYLTCAIC